MSRPTREQVARMAEAERRYPDDMTLGYGQPYVEGIQERDIREHQQDAFVAGAAWQAQQPRETVTTVEELDALPVGTVVLDSSARSWEKQEVRPDGFGIPVGWFRAGSPSYTRQAPLPATVIYRPEETPVNQPMKFRKKPIEVEAIQYRPGPGGNCLDVGRFIGDDSPCDDPCDPETVWYIQTLEGEVEAQPGDWIIRGVQGEFYPCKPDIFAATYEAVAP